MKTETPYISIIVPIYNVERYLKKCLESLISQTLYNVEIICIDDGSTDSSPAILDEYAARDPRIVTLRQANAGQASARNAGLRIARAPYIMFCDADDWYDPTMCEKMYAAIESSKDVDFAGCAVRMHYEHAAHMRDSDEKYYALKHVGCVRVNDDLLLTINSAIWNKIFRKAVIEENHIHFPEGIWYEDAAFFQLYGLCSHHAVFVPETFYHYRRRQHSIMSTTFEGESDHTRDLLGVARCVYAFLQTHHLLPAREHYFARLFFYFVATAQSYEKTLHRKQAILHDAEVFAKSTGIDFLHYPELAHQYQLITSGIPLNHTQKHLFGLYKKKYKAKGVKHYFLGIPFHTS